MDTAHRVSLAEMAARTGGVLDRAPPHELDPDAAPTLHDLTESLFFSPGDGRIWLDDQRMFLLATASFGALRTDLIETLGTQRARELFTRIGYLSGARDANIIRRRWPEGDVTNVLKAGWRLHALEGIVKVTPIVMDYDIRRGSFCGEFIWRDSTEASEHISAYGIGTTPACWMQIGYASGYASAFLGRLIVYREIHCAAMGHPHCHIKGLPADQWQDAEDDLQYFNFDQTCSRAVAGQANKAAAPSLSPDRPAAPNTEQSRIVGVSAAVRAALQMLERVAPTTASVLLTGESGTGKELFAKALHSLSGRADRPFIAINCAAIPDTLLEAELFGVERGAYTGATASRSGRFERASGGTLFLDEVASLSVVAQGKLLRAIQEGEIERIGGTKPRRVDVRIVAASNIDLWREVEAKRFRDDLFFRLNVFPIDLPPLRERRDDIPLLMQHFLALYSARHRRCFIGFTRRAVEALLNYDYPGNIRELQNLIERGVIYAEDGGAIDSAHMFRRGEPLRTDVFSLNNKGGLQHSRDERSLVAAMSAARHSEISNGSEDCRTLVLRVLENGTRLDDLESYAYDAALTKAKGNVSAAARLLGLTRAQLDYRLAKRRPINREI
jgi:two-component system, NtrC family, response regulator HydG